VNNDQEIIRLSELPRLFSVSKSSIYVWIKQGLLPRPFRLGIGCSAATVRQFVVFVAGFSFFDLCIDKRHFDGIFFKLNLDTVKSTVKKLGCQRTLLDAKSR
jgi:predicted DNA-binding transcriptional regulator AlpA